jgi:hypothetical protein
MKLSLVLAVAFTAVAFAAEAPKIFVKKDVSYGELREAIIDAGYEPAGSCDPQQFTACKAAYPELDDCAGTGTAPCRFVWKYPGADERLVVITQGEKNKIVVSVERTAQP